MPERDVVLFGDSGGAGTGSWLPLLLDVSRGRYIAPAAPASGEHAELRALTERVVAEHPGEPPVYAIVDSGLLADHPALRGKVEAEVNFSGEPTAEDWSGHGTICALLLLAVTPHVRRILNVKVAGADGRGTEDALLCGLRWIEAWARDHPGTRVVAGLSLGRYGRQWLGLVACRGGCRVCRAARRAADAGVWIVAAAGNYARRTACPAVAGLRGRHAGIVAITADGPDAGPGQFSAPGRLPDEFLAGVGTPAPTPPSARDPGLLDVARRAFARGDELGDANASFALGGVLMRLGDHAAARAPLERAERGGDPRAAYLLGVVAAAAGDEKGATAAYLRAANAGIADGDFGLGYLAYRRGDLAAARRHYAAASGKGHGQAANNLGVLLQEAGELEDAEAAYRLAGERGVDVSLNLAMLVFRRGDRDAAESLLRRAAAEGSPEAAFQLGFLLDDSGRSDEAATSYATADDAGHADAAFHLGVLHRLAGRIDDASAAWQRARERGHPTATHDLGLLAYYRGDLDSAESLWREADALGHPGAAHNLGVLLKQRGEVDEAQAAFARARDRGYDS